ncbi:Protein of uncharacterised function (DUF1292) [Clostridium sporogenes]|uniref:DUF1292 domain-containing protein n=1 Tax=Clostridium sporogenes TaxID=1509 RepID=A0A7U4JQP7_CLOSG|nr:DUF1292 domain-containing protein [Clostridium sporogenes]AKC63551.1 hypothetical protein DUF1292 [Clostridium sporogenes]AKJ90716.1 hypothetical protein CLSPOx_14170 [Clostridium sporogenes]KCZ67249.1 hypothetical protein DUF1292 [Clostridium sporogenes]OOO66710.1 hypothetical protein BS099_11005 [Clostridium sporogenes]UJA31241.1 DUF1292 domain-containing protein [Clostridium sporogenes]
MKDEKINSCGCGCGCGCEEEIEKDTCGCGEVEENCGCGCEDEECGETILVDLQDENGNAVTCEVIEEFEYKDNVYALVQNPENNSVYLFREEGQGDEVELVNPEEKEFDEVTAYYENLQ